MLLHDDIQISLLEYYLLKDSKKINLVGVDKDHKEVCELLYDLQEINELNFLYCHEKPFEKEIRH